MSIKLETDKYAELRPCYVRIAGKIDKPGFFHCWGMNNGTVGLVEDEQGKIHTVAPWRIRFLDDPGWGEYAWEHLDSDVPPMYDDVDDIALALSEQFTK